MQRAARRSAWFLISRLEPSGSGTINAPLAVQISPGRALSMREIDGLDYKAIAAALERPVNTVKSHLFRAREAIASRAGPLLAPTRDRRW